MNLHINVFTDTECLIFQCLELFRTTLPFLEKGEGVMLAGGRTPLEIYRRAFQDGLSTGGTLFLSDERYVPVTDPQSNYGTIVPMVGTLLRINTGLPIEAAAQAFHDDLGRIKRIPFGLLGLGTDGHTASLFTLTDAALRDDRLAIPVIRAEKPDRISVTPALLRRVEKLIILATGAEKQAVIQTLLDSPESIPAGVALAGHPNVELWTANG